MSFFTNAMGVNVQGGTFMATTTNNNNNTTNNYLIGPTGIDILREASAPEAAHDSAARTYSPRCFAGTREQYIEDITHWAIPSLGDAPKPIYWMRGPAGVGKSAIAQTCTENLHKRGALGAAFFFSIGGQRSPEKFFPSIAYQLSTIHSDYRDLVDKRVRYDKTVVNKAMQFQFRYLIDEPLRELEESKKGVRGRVQVFVDGLDECEGTGAQCEIIRIVAAAVSDGVVPLRWAFFSRPEAHLEVAFSRTGIIGYCYRTILPISRDVDGEIESYLRNGFDNILERCNAASQVQWPTPDNMAIVVEAAGGSFIYATTIIRFVSRPGSLGPQKRLHAIIDLILDRRERGSLIDPSTDAPFAELDAFYTLILQRVPPEMISSVHLFLALMCQHWSLGAMRAANLLGLSKDEFGAVCNYVSAVIYFGDPGKDLELDPTIDTSLPYTHMNPDVTRELHSQIILHLGGQVTFYHKSFFDFLLDPARSGSCCAKSSKALAKHYVKMHLDYDRSFCWRGSELVLAPGIPDSAASLSYPYTNEFVNSLLKAAVYIWVGSEDLDSFPPLGESRRSDADRDFRKRMHIWTNLPGTNHPFKALLWGCYSQMKIFPGVQIRYILRSEFSKFDIARFKSMIKQEKQATIIRRYHPDLTSKAKSFFRKRSREGVESALYRMGHGEKSIFWYWEINHKLEYYREFRTIDLAEGERIFREQEFDSGSESGSEGDDEDEDRDNNEDGKGRNSRGGREIEYGEGHGDGYESE